MGVHYKIGSVSMLTNFSLQDQYVRLLRDLRLACDLNGLVLTVTVPSRPSVIEVNYPVEKLDKYADYVILSTTEFRKLRKTSFIAPLYSCSPGSSNSIVSINLLLTIEINCNV